MAAEHDEDRDEPSAAVRDDAKEDGDSAREKKERVLHTRVPAVLELELKRLATNLKMPVSNLVRAILEDAVDAVDAVGRRAEGELHTIAEKMAKQRDALRTTTVRTTTERTATARGGAADEDAPSPEATAPAEVRCPDSDPALDGVIGFQSLVLASDAGCTVCGRKLAKGTKACRGVREESGPRLLLGPECRLLPGSTDEENET